MYSCSHCCSYSHSYLNIRWAKPCYNRAATYAATATTAVAGWASAHKKTVTMATATHTYRKLTVVAGRHLL